MSAGKEHLMPSNVVKCITFAGGLLALSACDPANRPEFLGSGTNKPGQTAENSTRLIERDIEAPGVFQVTEPGVWDGRPSLGGVWVAHPSVGDPERVIIRNPANGKFVIGALFKRDRNSTGPRLQVSSDAATALGVSAAIPQELNVTALRRATENDLEVIQPTAKPTAQSNNSNAPAPMGFDSGTSQTSATTTQKPRTTIKPQSRPTSLAKAFIQIGIFSVKTNADRTAKNLSSAGIPTQVIAQATNGKKFWRVISGPATTSAERNALLTRVKAKGFADAYTVSN